MVQLFFYILPSSRFDRQLCDSILEKKGKIEEEGRKKERSKKEEAKRGAATIKQLVGGVFRFMNLP